MGTSTKEPNTPRIVVNQRHDRHDLFALAERAGDCSECFPGQHPIRANSGRFGGRRRTVLYLLVKCRAGRFVTCPTFLVQQAVRQLPENDLPIEA